MTGMPPEGPKERREAQKGCQGAPERPRKNQEGRQKAHEGSEEPRKVSKRPAKATEAQEDRQRGRIFQNMCPQRVPSVLSPAPGVVPNAPPGFWSTFFLALHNMNDIPGALGTRWGQCFPMAIPG